MEGAKRDGKLRKRLLGKDSAAGKVQVNPAARQEENKNKNDKSPPPT